MVKLKLLVWVAWLAANPDKWQNYAGTASAYLVTAFAFFVWRGVDRRRSPEQPAVLGRITPLARWRAQSMATITGCFLAVSVFVVSVATDLRALSDPDPPYRTMTGKLRALVPSDVAVAGMIAEWFTFGGRNAFYAIDLRSLPGFNGSLDDLLLSYQPVYLVLRHELGLPTRRFEWVPNTATKFLAYVDNATELIAVLDDPASARTIEVRRALRPFRD